MGQVGLAHLVLGKSKAKAVKCFIFALDSTISPPGLKELPTALPQNQLNEREVTYILGTPLTALKQLYASTLLGNAHEAVTLF